MKKVLEEQSVEMDDSHLYEVTLVVAIPNYTFGMSAVQQASGADLVMEQLSHDPEIIVLNVVEKRLGLVERKDD